VDSRILPTAFRFLGIARIADNTSTIISYAILPLSLGGEGRLKIPPEAGVRGKPSRM
jgi:hypothetical protein